MPTYDDNQTRTAEYLAKFDREKTLRHLLPGTTPVIFDVGANVGMSLDEFKRIWPDASVHCFEPQDECYAELEQRARRYEGVAVNCCAAGSAPSEGADFYTHDISSGIAGFNRVSFASRDSIHLKKLFESGDDAEIAAYHASMNHKRQVRVMRLDDYMRVSRTAAVDLLKIDTQGFEPEVLAGFGERLADVDVVLTELMFYDYYERRLSFSDIERYLLPAGFALYDISHIAKNPMNGRTDWVDVIYVNERRRSGRTGV
jgi:FkbM family methyltransferase